MTKSKRDKQQEQDEDAIMERMNETLKRMMDTPPGTHKGGGPAPAAHDRI